MSTKCFSHGKTSKNRLGTGKGLVLQCTLI